MDEKPSIKSNDRKHVLGGTDKSYQLKGDLIKYDFEGCPFTYKSTTLPLTLLTENI